MPRTVGTAADWQASAVQVAGLFKQVKLKGLDAKALAKCSPATRAVFENPWSARWHSGETLTEFSRVVVELVGREGFADLNYDMARASFGPILRPMIQVALAITGRSPATVFARVPSSLESALRNVVSTWEPTGKTGGVLRFAYPCVIDPDTEWAWRGAIRFIGELSGTPARIDEAKLIDGSALQFTLSW